MDKDKLVELAERCERAIFPCPDEASVEEIVAIKSGICHLLFGRGYDAYSPDYTGSLDAAMTLVPEGEDWEVSAGPNDATAMILADESKGEAATPALALCAAALRSHAPK